MTTCGWFWGSHGCDAEEGHALLTTEDGGRCAHRCGLLVDRDGEGTLCCELRQAGEGDDWEVRHWYPATDDEPGEWGKWAAFAAPFRMDDGEVEVGQFVVRASAECFACQCEDQHHAMRHLWDLDSCPLPHTCKPRGVAVEPSIQDPFTGETTVTVLL